MTPIIQNNLQVGVTGDRVALGINQKPIAMFSALEAMMLASLLLKHAATILAGPGRELVKEAIEASTSGDNGAPPSSQR